MKKAASSRFAGRIVDRGRKAPILAVVLIVAGAGLVGLAPVVAPAPPAGPISLDECETVQLAVYETDSESNDQGVEQYDSLTEAQQSVFKEARAADGDFVRFRDSDRMAAANSLPHYVILNGSYFRAHSILGNCLDRPWYVGFMIPIGYLLLGLGVLVVGTVAWRRVTY